MSFWKKKKLPEPIDPTEPEEIDNEALKDVVDRAVSILGLTGYKGNVTIQFDEKGYSFILLESTRDAWYRMSLNDEYHHTKWEKANGKRNNSVTNKQP